MLLELNAPPEGPLIVVDVENHASGGLRTIPEDLIDVCDPSQVQLGQAPVSRPSLSSRMSNKVVTAGVLPNALRNARTIRETNDWEGRQYAFLFCCGADVSRQS